MIKKLTTKKEVANARDWLAHVDQYCACEVGEGKHALECTTVAHKHVENLLKEIDRLQALATNLASNFHNSAPKHDPENFRGCTHPDCIKLQELLRGQV